MAGSLYTAFFIPTRHEAQGIFSHLKISSKTSFGKSHIYEAQSKRRGQKVLLIQMGIGIELATKAAKYVFDHYPIGAAWLLGVCAATQAGHHSGHSFLATHLCMEDSSLQILETNSQLRLRAEILLKKASFPLFHGKILTVNRVIEKAEEKMNLGKKHDCLGLEMEAYPVALEAQGRKIPFLEVRWVLDPAEYEIPPVKNMVDESGNAKAIAAFKQLVLKPQLAGQIFPFMIKVRQALKPMNQFLHSYFEDGTI